ncbi:MAG: NAD+ synthase [Acidobacteria bacterium]|nr:NAD+ synthase [Acidobacteriota bacterium]
MAEALRVALCQANLTVGDLAGNMERLRGCIREARAQAADILVCPELAITGYPPEDLLLKPSFLRDAAAAVEELARDVSGIVALVGMPDAGPATEGGRRRLTGNAAAVLADGRVAGVYRKHHLPNYAVFDEQRYFGPGNRALVLDIGGCRVAVTICEDIWEPGGPVDWATMAGGAEVVVNLSASPYHRDKGTERERLFAHRARQHRCFLAFCNTVGGQDELVFDGHSLVIGPDGGVMARGPQFEEALLIVDLDPEHARSSRAGDARRRTADAAGPVDTLALPARDPHLPRPPVAPPSAWKALSDEAEIYHALTLGTADYVRKNHFPGAVLGLSGGIDSALALAVAVDALGPEAVTAVSMPSRYTADMNRDDAAELAARLGVRLMELPIEDLAGAYGGALAAPFAGTEPNVAEENLQARIRGNLLMALSNKFGWLVLTTGNKSEMSVGYATLYGDMAGGFAVLKDVLKTWVYRLAEWRNRDGEVIPRRILDKPPTAELRENQRDSDSLPPYDVLDGILAAYVEEDRSPAEIEALGFERETVKRVVQLVDRAEYKRRQAPPGVRITTRAFGKDRRLPITNRYASRAGA